MRLTPHPQGRHRKTQPVDYRPAFNYRPTIHPVPLVETWEQARTWYTPTPEGLWVRLVRLFRRNDVTSTPDTVIGDQQGGTWHSQTDSQPKPGHALSGR